MYWFWLLWAKAKIKWKKKEKTTEYFSSLVFLPTEEQQRRRMAYIRLCYESSTRRILSWELVHQTNCRSIQFLAAATVILPYIHNINTHSHTHSTRTHTHTFHLLIWYSVSATHKRGICNFLKCHVIDVIPSHRFCVLGLFFFSHRIELPLNINFGRRRKRKHSMDRTRWLTDRFFNSHSFLVEYKIVSVYIN